MANTNPITVADKGTGSTLTAAEFQQLLDALKNGTRDINTLGIGADTNVLFVDSGNNRVGILNGSPTEALDITGNIAVSGTVDGIDIATDVAANTAKLTCNTTNVTNAGALMDSEVTSLSGIKSLTVPDSTTISTFGASLIDDTTAANARTTLGLGTISTQDSDDVSITGGSLTNLTNFEVDSTGNSAIINHNDTSSYAFQVISTGNVTSTVNAISRFDCRGTSSTKAVIQIDNDGLGEALLINQNGNGKALNIESEATTTSVMTVDSNQSNTGNVFYIRHVDSSSTGDVLEAVNNGTGRTIFADQNGNGIALEIDSEATSNPLINLLSVVGNTRGDIAFGTARTSDPSTPSEGDLWYNSTDNTLRYYDGSATQDLPGSSGGGGTFWVERTQEGEVYTSTLMYYRAEDAVTLGEFVATLGARPAGQNFTIKMQKNGVDITGTSLSITTAASASNGVYSSSSGTLTESISAGDVLTVVVTQVGSTFAGADLSAIFKLS